VILATALEIVGGLSSPSKMPCHSWSTPAKYCKTGKKLAQVSGSICADCYAAKGFYRMPNVKNCLEKRFQSLSHPEWVSAMTLSISGSEGSGFFRWHDSGDIQSVEHLEKIVQIAKNLPNIQFWIPTREYSFGNFVSVYEKPQNDNRLVINSLGEGGIWVCNINGNLENGDYITSSLIPGIGMKQNDNILRNYSILYFIYKYIYGPRTYY
jgi:hypothetical protein